MGDRAINQFKINEKLEIQRMNQEKIIGKNVNIGMKDIFLKNTIYEIDHDYLGYKLKENIKLLDVDNKINLRRNDKFFKIDVLYYLDKSNNVEVFYDAITKNLLGYKERNKEYVNLSSIDTKYSKLSTEELEIKKKKIIS